MASYLSYFTSNSSSTPPQQQYSQAQPASSTWANTFSSRIATLRKALTKDSEEDDPENEDCSHVSNVLRAYYTQKGRAFPEWLPPDPKKPQPIPQMQASYGQYGNVYNNNNVSPYGQSGHSRGPSGSGGLSDLWDSTPAQRPAPQSLRAPRPGAQVMRSDNSSRPGSNDAYGAPNSQQSLSARPLPSQRAGSFQNTAAANAPVSSKSERLRARLQGGNSGRSSPAPPLSAQTSYSESTYQRTPSDMGSYSSPASSRSNIGGYDPYAQGGNQETYGGHAYRQRPGGPR